MAGEGFFDVHSRLTAKRVEASRAKAAEAGIAAAAAAAASAANGATSGAPGAQSGGITGAKGLAGGIAALTVTQLTAQIEKAIKTGLPANVLVRGEVSNFNTQRGGSGHSYFTLKDAGACIDCVMWKDATARLKFTPADGLEVIAGGRVGVYGQRGRYQLYASTLEPLGKGALELAFQQLRAKLQAEGLFARERKRPLPAYPMSIALVTSRNTAALQDMLKVFRLYPWLRLVLFHTPVQGDGSAAKIAEAIGRINSPAMAAYRFDVIVLARGGGSLEDLWAFNEEIVARAVVKSALPVITGIGHEVDVSIADLAADYHAHTPTEAARVLTARWETSADTLDMLGIRLRRAMRTTLQEARQRLEAARRHEFFRRPMDRINGLRQLLDDRQRSLSLAVSARLRRSARRVAELNAKLSERHPRHAVAMGRQRLDAFEQSLRRALIANHQRLRLKIDAIEAHLRAVGPEEVLKRGYTITVRKKDGVPLKSAKELKGGERLVTRFAEGSVESVADDPDQPTLF